ncbi:MAG TPA: hypothetical protein DCY13_19865, partial [Verrucomicrobiales bacterium]|nr:hypothetical protein [Verrucomicrobiales bacterium]
GPLVPLNSLSIDHSHLVPVTAGDAVELVGAPARTEFAPYLVDVEYRRLGPGPPPGARRIRPEALADGANDAALVTVRARLRHRETTRAGGRLREQFTLDAAGAMLEARFEGPEANAIPELPGDALLEVTGLCTVMPDPGKRGRTVRLWLRGAEDVHYLGRPPFWDDWPMRQLALGGFALTFGTMTWVVFLRRQVRQRTSALVAANGQLLENAARLRQSEQEVQRALRQEKELSQLKTHFVNTVSHEFRTPLGVIMASAENLRDYHDRFSADQRAGHLGDIVEASRTMSGLMEEVLLLGRVESGKVAFKPAPLDLRSLCERLVEEVGAATDQRCPIRFACALAGGDARGDDGLLRHILVNLLSNAVKYSPAGRPVEFRLEARDNFAVFTVSDQGAGIAAADLPHLFEPFHRGANVGDVAGSGLGLAIVKRCVDLHGGTVECSSREGDGTTFTVRVPVFGRLA